MADKVKVTVVPHAVTGEVYTDEEIYSAMQDAGWTDDPRDGVACLMPDGREVLNPLPIAPPIGFNPQPSMLDVIRQQIRNAKILLDGEDEIDSEEEADDFEVEEEYDPASIYEIEMYEDAPDLPSKPAADVVVEDRKAKAPPAAEPETEKGA